MQKSESIAKLAKALAAFQGEVKNPYNSTSNPFYKSKYAPLGDVLALVRPILSKNGLSIIQESSADAGNCVVKTTLLHDSGEWIESDPLTLKLEKNTPQGVGSAMTYGKRYSVCAILGISSDDDDDGNEHEKKKDDSKPKQENKPVSKPTPPKPQISKEVQAVTDETKVIIGKIIKEEKATQDGVKEAILKHSTQANYTQVTDIKVAKAILEEVKKLDVEVKKEETK